MYTNVLVLLLLSRYTVICTNSLAPNQYPCMVLEVLDACMYLAVHWYLINSLPKTPIAVYGTMNNSNMTILKHTNTTWYRFLQKRTLSSAYHTSTEVEELPTYTCSGVKTISQSWWAVGRRIHTVISVFVVANHQQLPYVNIVVLLQLWHNNLYYLIDLLLLVWV